MTIPCFDVRLEYVMNIGKRVMKTGRKHRPSLKLTNVKPFKSGEMINTVKGVIIHPQIKVPAYIFEEDDSYVDCRICRGLDGK